MSNTALITGASKRIGKAIAEHLAETGWSLVVHYHNSQKLANELITNLQARFPEQRFMAVRANLADTKEVVGLIPKVVSELGEFDLLVNNASVFHGSHIKETSTELYNMQMDVNLRAPVLLMRDFANYCKKGNVINFVDTRIAGNKSNYAAYSLSKKGLWDFTKMAAVEFAPQIRVNAIAPGLSLAPENKDSSYLESLAKQIPMQRPGGLNPILQSLDYILKNDYLTGQLLFADGGENLGTK